MFGAILTLVACFVACGGVMITAGPTGQTKEVGSNFTLQCKVSNKQSQDSVFWSLLSENSETDPKLLLLDTISKASSHYSLEGDSYNLVVTHATIDDDGVFECEAGEDKRTARIYVYDKPEEMILDWEHGINRPGAVEANEKYKLRCTTIRSYPQASHRYFKEGVELKYDNMLYIYENETDSNYVNVTSILPFTPSKDDVNEMRSIRCVADLYNMKNVSSLAFGINFAASLHQVQLGGVLLMVASAVFAW